MKIDPNQGPPPAAGSEGKTDAAAVPGKAGVQGAAGQGKTAADAPLASPFFSLLRKGKKGEGESLKSGEPGESGELGAFTEMPQPGAPVEGKIPRNRREMGQPGEILDPNVQPDPTGRGPKLHPWEGKEGKGGPHLPHRGPTTARPERAVDPRTGPLRTLPAKTDQPVIQRDPKAPAAAAPMFHAEAPVVRNVTDPTPVGEVHAAGSTAEVERIQAIANEIVDKVQASKTDTGDDRVDIQFNSRTLQGLQVSISRNDAGVSIRFQTGSEPVSQLLSQNTADLVQALQARGVQVGDVTVVPNTPPSSEAFNRSRQDSRQDSRQGSRGGSGGEGGSAGEGGSGGSRGQRGGR